MRTLTQLIQETEPQKLDDKQIQMIKQVAMSDAAPEHKKTAIDAIVKGDSEKKAWAKAFMRKHATKFAKLAEKEK